MDINSLLAKKAEYNRRYMPEYAKSRRAVFQSQGRCGDCGSRDERTETGGKLCGKCLERRRAYRHGNRAEKKPAKNPEELRAHLMEYHKTYQRERREAYRKHGRCTECGDQDALTLNGKGRCQRCAERKSGRLYVSAQEREIEKGNEPKDAGTLFFERVERTRRGLCYICGNPSKDGYKVCDAHYESLARARQKISKENHPFAAYNKILFEIHG